MGAHEHTPIPMSKKKRRVPTAPSPLEFGLGKLLKSPAEWDVQLCVVECISFAEDGLKVAGERTSRADLIFQTQKKRTHFTG